MARNIEKVVNNLPGVLKELKAKQALFRESYEKMVIGLTLNANEEVPLLSPCFLLFCLRTEYFPGYFLVLNWLSHLYWYYNNSWFSLIYL